MDPKTPPLPQSNHPSGPVPDSQAIGNERFEDVFYDFRPQDGALIRQEKNVFSFSSQNQFSLVCSLATESVLRLTYSSDLLDPAPFGYALDDNLTPPTDALLSLETHPDGWSVAYQNFEIYVSKTDLAFHLKDRRTDKLRFGLKDPLFLRKTTLKGVTEFSLRHALQPGERYFGLGDKSGPLLLNGHRYAQWNTDAFAFGALSDPLYKSIPFFYQIDPDHCLGIFLNNPYPSHFDFGQQDPEALEIRVEGGPLDLFFLLGPTPGEVAAQYALLTGRPELPPLWALGFHQCRWSYFPESRLLEVAQEFRDRRIPCDALYLDIDYMDAFRCFTWDESHFPAPKKMIETLRDQGFRTVAMIDPGIKQENGYWVYDEGLEQDVFCRRTNGDLMTGPVWPGMCVFPDFTRPDVRTWWGDLYRELYCEIGIHGFWNDMNEPAVFKVHALTFPEEVRHDFDGYPTNHKKAHNIYGQQMARATFEGLKKLDADRRPFVITRATFSGGQRHAWTWTGDNVASWEHLRIANRQCQRMSVSGYPFVGTDIGGFVDQPDGELFLRWLQLGLFHPLFRVHSMGNNEDGASPIDADAVHEQETLNRLDQEPWSFGPSWEKLARQAIEMRYHLIGYWYTTICQHVQTGAPVLRHLFFEDPADPNLYPLEDGFLFGRQLIAWPVQDPGVEKIEIYLPQGTWYPLEGGTPMPGGEQVSWPVTRSSIPVWVRGGSILPWYPLMQYTQEKPIEVIELRVFFQEGDHESELYEDGGDGYGYQQGEFLLRTFQCTGSSHALTIRQGRKGDWSSDCHTFRLRFWGLPFVPERVRIDGLEHILPPETSLSDHGLEVGSNFSGIELL